jgi:PhzF family phenazine biosynthesis protein
MDDANARPMGAQMDVPIFQVDAFAGRLFAGNPAAVCPLDKWLPDETMQAIAAENNLAETAFFVRIGDDYELRWFTPEVEIELCGHATLASGFVIMTKLAPHKNSTRFHTKSGILNVTRDGAHFKLDLPSQPPKPAEMPAEFVAALGPKPREMLAATKYLAVYDSAEEVAALQPDLAVLRGIDKGVIVTAPGPASGSNACDFVSRFFAPHIGIPEDPVTGGAHCTLVPYWAKRLGKTKLQARQLSARGGELFCEDQGRRVSLSGKAVLYLEGRIHV